MYPEILLHNHLPLHLYGRHYHDHWVRGWTNTFIPLCMGKRHQFFPGGEAITSTPPLHQEGAIIIEGGQSVWGSDGVEISEIWMEGGLSAQQLLYL